MKHAVHQGIQRANVAPQIIHFVFTQNIAAKKDTRRYVVQIVARKTAFAATSKPAVKMKVPVVGLSVAQMMLLAASKVELQHAATKIPWAVAVTDMDAFLHAHPSLTPQDANCQARLLMMIFWTHHTHYQTTFIEYCALTRILRELSPKTQVPRKQFCRMLTAEVERNALRSSYQHQHP